MNGPGGRLLLLAGAGLVGLLSPGVQSEAREKSIPLVQPWKRIALDPEFGGAWVVAGDLDGDGTVEIVSARNVDQNDVHFTSAVVAQRLDSSMLWRWGNRKIGRKELHHDVACQIYDWDGDGRNEVVLCAGESLLELDGVTGREKRRLPSCQGCFRLPGLRRSFGQSPRFRCAGQGSVQPDLGFQP